MRYGAHDMFSIPPATTHSASPARIAWAASATVFRPLPQTLLMVVEGTVSTMPAPIADWRAGFCPSPAWSTLPMSTSSGVSTPARRSASSTAAAPSLVAGTSTNAPPNVPTGVRTALTITASSMRFTLPGCDDPGRQRGAHRGLVPDAELVVGEPMTLRPTRLHGKGAEHCAHPP